mmetsp:Transcript_20515/g.23243  ORF Transcript_20515/g.23243 Transcript_20515/m.23243 type:complete len:208 (+) Transcript_20515:49-672(+)
MANSQFLSSEQSRELWDSHAKNQELKPELWTNLTEVELQYMSRLDTAKSVCVAAAGDGLSGFQVFHKVSKDCKIIVGDLSPERVKLAKLWFTRNGIEINDSCSNITVQIMDNQDLPIESGSCDRYISNLSIMLVPEPLKQLEEAYRILEEGGIAALSTWGREEYSTFFTLPTKVAFEMGIKLPARRSPFFLGDEKDMQIKMKEVGFT